MQASVPSIDAHGTGSSPPRRLESFHGIGLARRSRLGGNGCDGVCTCAHPPRVCGSAVSVSTLACFLPGPHLDYAEFETSFAPSNRGKKQLIIEEAHGFSTHHRASFPCEELERAPELHDAPSRWPSECEGGVGAEGGGDAGPGCFGTGEPSEEEERRRQGRRETERKVGKMKGACAEKGRELICMLSDGQSRHLDRTRKEA